MKKVLALFSAAIVLYSAAGCSLMTFNSTSTETGTLAQQSDESYNAENNNSTEADSIKPGHYIQNEKFKFSFVKAKQYDEIAKNEYFTDTPADGKKYLLMFFEVENVSGKDQYVNYLYFKGYEDDYAVDMDYIFSDIDGYSTLTGNLSDGKKLKGFIAYEVNQGWKNFDLEYKEIGNNEPLKFNVTPNDLSK